MSDQVGQLGIPQWTLADRLEKARKQAGAGQLDLARELGLSKSAISKFERGESVPRVSYLKVWAMFCGVPYEWLKDGVTESPHPDALGGRDESMSSGGRSKRRKPVTEPDLGRNTWTGRNLLYAA